jgi:uncharacterized protein involved in tolerance to divalent cations
MVNIIIYLNSESDAEQLAIDLLKAKLVAHASIDIENKSFVYDNELIKEINFVVTVQTKALLFTAVEEYVKNHYGENIKIFSLPITQCNKAFYDYLLEHAVKV